MNRPRNPVLRSSAVELDATERFGPLATAIAGRRLGVQLVERLALPFTDGASVFVPASLPPDGRRTAVALQAGLVAAGSLAVPLLRRLRRRRDVARYLALEGHRVCRRLEETLPGLAPELRSRLTAMPVTRSAEESLAWARRRHPVPDPSPLFGELRRDALERTEANAPAAAFELQTDGPGDERRSRPSGLVDGALAEWTRRLLGIERGAGLTTPGAKTGGHPFLPGPARGGEPGPGRRPVAVVSFASRSPAPGAHATRACRHPEFDVRTGRYRPDWCTVYEVSAADRAGIGELRVADAGLQRRLARVGLSLRRERRQREGDDLDLDAIVSRVADVSAHAEAEADERVYVGLRRLARSFGVLLLVDVSGSTSDPSPSGRPVLEVQADAAARLIRAFSSLGVSVAAYAFRSQGRSAVRLERLLSFLEHSPAAGIERLLRVRSEGFTRLGAAVRHASTVLFDEAGTRERLLLVLSDGFAFDIDYEGGYAEADARRALEEARSRGVACLCLSLGSAETDAGLQRVFGSAAHASASQLSQLVDRLPALMRHALAEGRGRRVAA